MKIIKTQIAERIAGRLLYYQRKTADYLNRKTAGMSRKLLLLLLAGFCLASGSYCLYLLIKAFY